MADDLSRLGEWNAALIRDEGHDNPMTVAELTERMREWLVGEYRARIFVCDSVDTGYALYRELREFVHLRQFYIASEHRRRGIGAAALAFWRACGFCDRYVGLEAPPLPEASGGRAW